MFKLPITASINQKFTKKLTRFSFTAEYFCYKHPCIVCFSSSYL